MQELPSGAVTFLFTDVKGSTLLWEEQPGAMRVALERHDVVLRHAIESSGGVVFKTVGDAFCAAFSTPSDAVVAAVAGQIQLCHPPSAESDAPLELRIRMAIHTGAAEPRSGDYFGPTLNRVARLLAAAHGGQIILSAATQELIRESPFPGSTLKNMGEHRLRDLARPECIYQLVHPDLRCDFPPLETLNNPELPHNLPQQSTSFVGREKELCEVKDLLATARLVSVTGPGGTGKTRLCLHVAADLLETYREGVWLVELAALTDEALIPQAVASVLGVKEEQGKTSTLSLVSALKDRKILLILDNCEHLVFGCAALADSLLRGCSRISLLTTGREGLNISGETTYRLPTLTIPDPQELPTLEALIHYEAVKLFLDRACAALPSFELTRMNAPAIAQVCWRLDGIALAIELAAVCVKAMQVEKLNERLDDRFRLLTRGSRTAVPRQQTLRALVDWSYDLLSEPEQRLLRRLSVFAGGWTLEAAETVCEGDGIEKWDVLDLLTALVEKSLVVMDLTGGEARYRLLETVRHYAFERLSENHETEAARRRHRDWSLILGEQSEPALRSPQQVEWLDRLEAEHENFRLALEWCGSDPESAEAELRLAVALHWYWVKRSYLTEGRYWTEAALARSSGSSSLRMAGLISAGRLGMLTCHYGAAIQHLQAALDMGRETADTAGMATALAALSVIAAQFNKLEQNMELAEEGLVRARESGDPRLIAHCMGIFGWAVRMSGDLSRAAALFHESLALMSCWGDNWELAWARINLGGVSQMQEDYESARTAYQQALALCWEMRDKRAAAWCLECLAEVAASESQPERGAKLMGAAEALLSSIGATWPPNYVAGRERTMVLINAAIGPEATSTGLKNGAAMPLSRAIDYALEAPLSV